ncbi:MAG: hypothetical protein RLZZ618_1925 [Pseudomonadota bacterium]
MDVRARSAALASPLSAEDQCVQSMPDASPTKWHLAHTTWFFESMVLEAFVPDYRVVDPQFGFLFNSYYESLGPRHPRPQRGLLTRPALSEVQAYRKAVDAAVLAFIEDADDATFAETESAITLGLHHEQQHQELMLTDVLHLLSLNPTQPLYRTQAPMAPAAPLALDWLAFEGGRVAVGHGRSDFAFDNETPRHDVLLRPYALANRPVTNAEYLAFIHDGGYRDPRWWLSDGWAAVQANGWEAPAYWSLRNDGQPRQFSLHGPGGLDPHAPVAPLSLFEAAAYAAWAGARLPTEFEWEAAVSQALSESRCSLERRSPERLVPTAPTAGPGLRGLGEVWEWTRSAYDPYPGFRPFEGPASEYNGKFMVGQVVLRGGSCASPPGHVRATYRNFFPPGARWQFSGLRLARDL